MIAPQYPFYTYPSVQADSVLATIAKVLSYMTAVVSLFMIPMHVLTIIMSLDPGFNVYFLMTVIVISVKIAAIVYFFIYFYGAETEKPMAKIMFLLGEMIVGIAWILIVPQVIRYSGIGSVFTNPFVLDFGLFIVVNSLVLYIALSTPTPNPFYYPMQMISHPQLKNYFSGIPMTYVPNNIMIH